MQDFVNTLSRQKRRTTENFKSMVEKHMTTRNGMPTVINKMDWFLQPVRLRDKGHSTIHFFSTRTVEAHTGRKIPHSGQFITRNRLCLIRGRTVFPSTAHIGREVIPAGHNFRERFSSEPIGHPPGAGQN